MSNEPSPRSPSRRQFINTAFAGAAVGLASQLRLKAVVPEASAAPLTRTPEGAVRELRDGNQRYASSHLTSPQRDLRQLRASTVDEQKPFAAVLACADSRMPVELVFDQSIGQLFVVRIAGNVVTPEIVASLEYAVAVLGVNALLVLGHSHCGAVKAAMTTDVTPGQISSLYPYLRPAVDKAGGDVEKGVAVNAVQQAHLLRTSSTVIAKALAARTLDVVSGVYDLGTGRVALS
jgi:carbonic anhydrase